MACGCRGRKKKAKPGQGSRTRVVYVQKGSQPPRKRIDERVRRVRKKK